MELILGELVPKALALRFTDTVALLVAPRRRLLARFSRCAVVFLTASTRAVLRLFGIERLRPADVRLRGGDQTHGPRGARAGRPGPDGGRADPQRLRVRGDAGEEGDGAAAQDLRPRREHAAGRGGAPDRRERVHAHPRVRRLARQHGRPRLHQGRAAAAREAPAGGAAEDPAPRAFRAGDQEGRGAAERAAEAPHPHGARHRRARLGDRPRHPRGPPRGDRGRDPGRIRLGGASGRAAARRVAGRRRDALRGRAA